MKKPYIAAGIVLAAIIGISSAYYLVPSPAPERTFYIVSYHWGFAAFDENGVELDEIRVPKGTEVTLYAINHHAHDALHEFPTMVHEGIEDVDFHGRSEVEGIVPEPADTTLHELIEEAEEQELLDHGLLLMEFGINAVLEAHATEPLELVFTVDTAGEYTFSCTVYCGYGHEYMKFTLFVT
ncbi:MAG: hypothetical protein ACE5IB_03790 [Candidatus Geothermarchaeales archaeon]